MQKMKELLKSDRICQSCRKNKSGSFLLTTGLGLYGSPCCRERQNGNECGT